ncbi:hypothetical protein NQ674_13660 [Acinetobacter baumannii]|nr:hypothetical protein [Acinetobacter baumannii]
MLTVIAETIISFFVSTYESKKYPYLTCFVKGMIIGLFAFVTSNVIDFINKDMLKLKQQILFFCLSVGLGIIMFLFFSFFTWLERTDFSKK